MNLLDMGRSSTFRRRREPLKAWGPTSALLGLALFLVNYFVCVDIIFHLNRGLEVALRNLLKICWGLYLLGVPARLIQNRVLQIALIIELNFLESMSQL